MNKKEISEIKKLFSLNKCCLSSICGCYVDGNKDKVTTFRNAFMSLPDEEAHKYFKIFKNALSGTVGKNTLNMEFPLDAEGEGTTHEMLLQLRDSALKDDDLLDLFYNKIIDNYLCAGNYLILLANGTYDIPGKGSDNLTMDDASEYVYEHIICTICPVNLDKEGLCYNAESNTIENKIRDWMVERPDHAFLFPAFNERNSDIHSLLYYTRNPESMQSDFIGGMLGCNAPMSAKTQKHVFEEIIEETLAEDLSFEMAKTVHENLTQYIEERKELPDTVTIDKSDFKKILEESGAGTDKMSSFEGNFNDAAGSRTQLVAGNVAPGKTFDVKMPQVTVKVASDRTDLIETRVIDGKKYLLIEITDEVEVNGMPVKP